jgi:hypothetical protein
MSSTSRGSERSPQDYYYTPITTIQDFWRKFCLIENKTINDFPIIRDPCAGGDDERPCAYPEALKQFDYSKSVMFNTIDIRDDSRARIKGDYLQIPPMGLFPLIISNPPFSLFEQFVRKSLTELEENGYLCYLQRLNVVGGQKRKTEFWDDNKPKAIYIHSKRPSFCKGSSDSCEYAHFVWQNGYAGETKFYWV